MMNLKLGGLSDHMAALINSKIMIEDFAKENTSEERILKIMQLSD